MPRNTLLGKLGSNPTDMQNSKMPRQEKTRWLSTPPELSTQTRSAKTKLRQIKTHSVRQYGHNQSNYIRTMEHIISADESETVKIIIKSMDWACELAELFSRGNTKIIHEVMNDLRTKYNREFDVSTLFEKLEQITANKVHWTSTSPESSFGENAAKQ
jgi:hypothetical protein